MGRPERGGIGYVLRRFPKISETFILNEILALEARGEPVHIFSLLPTRDPRFHAELSRLKASVSYLPDVFEMRKLLRYNAYARRRSPAGYRRAAFEALRGRRPGHGMRLLQAGYVAERARRMGLRRLHAHFATEPACVASLASRISGLPYSFTAHAVDIYKNNVVASELARRIDAADFVVTVSDWNRSHLQCVANGSADKVVRVYNGIDFERFSPGKAPPPEPFTILSVARLVEKKGLDVLVAACARLRDRGRAFRCWIAGRGALRPALEAQIRASGLRRHVRLLGAHTQPELLERYRSAHAFALPCVVGSDGNRDGLPVSIVEALACGVPVVATPVTGIPEVVRHDHNGLLVGDRDAAGLADALESLMCDGDRHRRLQANARASVAGLFDVRATADELARLFREGRA